MDIAAILASDGDTAKQLPEISGEDIATLENEIDKMTAELPKLTCFIIPGENLSESFVHLSRSICRRAERVIVTLTQEGYQVPELPEAYINRLSDFLFTYARRLNENSEFWIPKVK
jgi:cob(I)alamin adenosyltransferase